MCVVIFFFSSRRRHTRFDCDWSSDVCSSDLCPRTALGCVTVRVEAGASPAALLEEMKAREAEIQKLAVPRSVLASPQGELTRMAYKALGKDPSRDRGSAETLFRRVGTGKGLPQINAVLDTI